MTKAAGENWILITTDKDFGDKVYREKRPHHGVILLRLADERTPNKIDVMERLLAKHAADLVDQFVVVTESRVRFSRQVE